MFLTFSSRKINTYLYLKDTILGPTCEFVECTCIPEGYQPVLFYSGSIWNLTLHGKLVLFQLISNSPPKTTSNDFLDCNNSQLTHFFQYNLKFNRFGICCSINRTLNDKTCWRELAKRAQFLLDVELALSCFRLCSDPGIVLALEKLIYIEERNLIAAYMLLYNGDFNKAQDLFLCSSTPINALELRRDLLNWDKALQLAKSLDPFQIPLIGIEFAQQLEFQGDYKGALENYNLGISSQNMDNHLICSAGIAKNSIRVAEYQYGIKLAREHPSSQIKAECANLLEEMTLYSEAAQLYEEANELDKAATLFARLKQWNKVCSLLTHVRLPKIHFQYAKAKEAEGCYMEAIESYKMAKNYESIVRVYLEYYNNSEEAIKVVLDTKSPKGAEMIARYVGFYIIRSIYVL